MSNPKGLAEGQEFHSLKEASFQLVGYSARALSFARGFADSASDLTLRDLRKVNMKVLESVSKRTSERTLRCLNFPNRSYVRILAGNISSSSDKTHKLKYICSREEQ